MLTAFIVLLAGLILIYAEFYLPGGIMGVTGAIAMLLAVVFFAQSSPSVIYVLLFVVLSLAGLIGVIKLAMKQISSRHSGGVYLDSDQEGYTASSHNQDLVGHRGTVLSEMRPSGYISVDGKRLQAVSRAGLLEKGTEVEVIGGEGAHLIVKPLKK